MTDITREIDQDLEVDVLGLQSLSSPSGLLGSDLAELGGHGGGGNTCAIVTVTCCQTCNNTVCNKTINL